MILRHAEEAGIDKTIIFPIENPTYQKANEEIARIVERHPGKFIGFAKHDPGAEAGKIERLRERSISFGSRGDPCCSRKCLPLKMIPASRLVVRT